MKFLKTQTFLAAFFLFNLNYAQQLKGLVINEHNQPLEGTYVYNLNSKSHTHVLDNGLFILNETKAGDSIKFGLLGYNTKILTAGNLNETIKIVLAEKSFQLDELVISEQLNALNTVTKLDLKITPVNSSQEVLRKVPGLIIGQHAGGGKAEQLFLRGFDVDHGTDISLSVDGIPVNMVSHAHGQGYSDLHFIIPETIGKIGFGKGPYYPKEGDFNTAGYVDFSTKDYIKESSISFSAGQFNTLRTLGMFNLLENIKAQNAYIALEYLTGDGPFDSPQNFNRLNLFGKYVMFTQNNDKLSLTTSHFTSRWDASGQIPQRAVNAGSISRFGSIDDTEGGTTSRTNFNLEFTKQVSDYTTFKTNAFYSNYNFELYSNFTFFLEDITNGDQIKQKENRDVFGVNTAFSTETFLGKTPLNINYGLGLRHDISNDNELSKTINKTIIKERVQLGDINQTNIDAFINAKLEFGAFTVSPALRFDYFKFLYNDKLQNDGKTLFKTKFIVSPKLNFFYNANNNLQWFLKSGIGFHSNDTRVVVTNKEENILPRAYGVDLGNIWKPSPKLMISTAAWYLFLEQEFVYVGDAGIVEPSGKTERLGLDFGVRYQFNDWLFFDTDATLTKARSKDDPKGQNHIPLAPDFTMAGGLSIKDNKGFSGSIKYRYIDDRPANEDNSIIADGYLVTDLNANYSFSNITLGVVIENLFDTQWNETQFATESRLQNEMQPVEEIHFTPGTPFFIKGSITYKF
ncbi:TonB-dependent receptor [Flavivirga sp. 57AJ16]|uniref:TonB-dependent receptor n=1 Tax=Flavivirga sp. 57AJ16 TaxID=3025307 RepID=UPI0023658858|nr:TonB-dependent receptor plug domain-containing protein [Flavivirga sp. 57AJ16]MDD7884413.1 TonB-dependent receptor plug domain-containing protein [Flavivirga sp. 57AJ16]